MKYYLFIYYNSEGGEIEEFEDKVKLIDRIISSGCTSYRIFTDEVKLTINEDTE